MIGYVQTPAGRVAFAEVQDGGGIQYRSPRGQCFRRSLALRSPHWTEATWPAWLPRRADGGLPDSVPAWLVRGLPRTNAQEITMPSSAPGSRRRNVKPRRRVRAEVARFEFGLAGRLVDPADGAILWEGEQHRFGDPFAELDALNEAGRAMIARGWRLA
jgi:hypothetical protein